MKLLTHNMLQCPLPGVTHGFPFIIEATKISEIEADFEPGRSSATLLPYRLHIDFLKDLYKKIDWGVFRQAAIAVQTTC